MSGEDYDANQQFITPYCALLFELIFRSIIYVLNKLGVVLSWPWLESRTVKINFIKVLYLPIAYLIL